jgi:type IV pilus assembly protein PilF
MKYLLPLFLLMVVTLSACALGESSRKEAVYHYQMGLSYLGEKNFTSALVELVEAEKLNPDDPEVLNSLGWAYYQKDKFVIAEQKFLKAISIKPDYSLARYNLGLTYMAMKEWDDALKQFKLVADDIFSPGQQAATVMMGKVYNEKGDHGKALDIFRSLVASNPGSPAARFNLARTYHAMGKTDLAIEEYKKSIMLGKDNGDAYYYLGLIYLQNRNKEAAASAFKEVVRTAPDSEIGLLSREHLESLK